MQKSIKMPYILTICPANAMISIVLGTLNDNTVTFRRAMPYEAQLFYVLFRVIMHRFNHRDSGSMQRSPLQDGK